MTFTRGLAIAFWGILALTVMWQIAILNNSGVSRAKPKVERVEHHYFYHRPGTEPAEDAKPPDAPILKQTSFTVEPNVPQLGMVTCHVVVTNSGVAKAVRVQINVHPYKGGIQGNPEESHRGQPTSNTYADSLWAISQWLPLPDIAPGESCPPQTITFPMQGDAITGTNFDPEIIFEKEKPKP